MKDELDFSGKCIWVTGAGQGIGAKVAHQFQELGGDVIGIDRSFTQEEYPYETVLLDISDSGQVELVCQQLISQKQRVDVLVNAAGILRMGALEDFTVEHWQESLNVNASGVFYLFRQLIPLFKQQGFGSVVSVASNAAHVPRLGMAAYCASKSAMVSLSHCVGLELAPFGVRCNVVSPGSTDTPMLANMLADSDGVTRTIAGIPDQYKLGIPLGKIATPADVANTVIFLASDLAGHITMQDIVIDGGATLAA